MIVHTLGLDLGFFCSVDYRSITPGKCIANGHRTQVCFEACDAMSAVFTFGRYITLVLTHFLTRRSNFEPPTLNGSKLSSNVFPSLLLDICDT
jgi:hypothetical protein